MAYIDGHEIFFKFLTMTIHYLAPIVGRINCYKCVDKLFALKRWKSQIHDINIAKFISVLSFKEKIN